MASSLSVHSFKKKKIRQVALTVITVILANHHFPQIRQNEPLLKFRYMARIHLAVFTPNNGGHFQKNDASDFDFTETAMRKMPFSMLFSLVYQFSILLCSF